MITTTTITTNEELQARPKGFIRADYELQATSHKLTVGHFHLPFDTR
jgi:hypothetical protein